MAVENDDRPRQNQKKDNAESSKQKGKKRKGDDLVAAADLLDLLARMTSPR